MALSNFLQMLDIQLTLVLFLFIGILCFQFKIITDESRPSFMKLLLNIFLPIMVFNSFSKITIELLQLSLIAVVVGTIIYIIIAVISPLLYKKYNSDKRPILEYATLVNNAGFAGLPLVTSIFGDAGAIIGSVYLVPHRIFTWTVGLQIYERSSETNIKDAFIKLMKNPSIIAVVLGLVRGLLSIPLPDFMDRGFASIASAVQPMAMIVIGSVIAKVDYKSLIEPGIIKYCVIRLIVIPLIVLGVMKLLQMDPVLTGVVTIMAGMPAGTPTPILAAQYDLNVPFAAKLTFVSIMLSVITSPILMLFV